MNSKPRRVIGRESVCRLGILGQEVPGRDREEGFKCRVTQVDLEVELHESRNSCGP